MAAGHATITDPAMRQQGYLLVAEAARKLKHAPQTLYRWVEDGRVKGCRDGYRRYVLWVSILEHLGPVACQSRGLTQASLLEETHAPTR